MATGWKYVVPATCGQGGRGWSTGVGEAGRGWEDWVLLSRGGERKCSWGAEQGWPCNPGAAAGWLQGSGRVALPRRRRLQSSSMGALCTAAHLLPGSHLLLHVRWRQQPPRRHGRPRCRIPRHRRSGHCQLLAQQPLCKLQSSTTAGWGWGCVFGGGGGLAPGTKLSATVPGRR